MESVTDTSGHKYNTRSKNTDKKKGEDKSLKNFFKKQKFKNKDELEQLKTGKEIPIKQPPRKKRKRRHIEDDLDDFIVPDDVVENAEGEIVEFADGEKEGEWIEDEEEETSDEAYLYNPYSGWKEYMEDNEDDIENYGEYMKNLYEKIMNFKHILKSNLPIVEKEEAINAVSVLYSPETPLTKEWFAEQKELYNKIKFFNSVDADKVKYFEREEMKMVDMNLKELPLKNRILNLPISDDQKAYVYSQFEEMEKQNRSSDEYSNYRQWIDTVLKIPFNVYKPLPIQSNSSPLEKEQFIKQKLEEWDKEMEGLHIAKEEAILSFMDQLSSDNVNSKVLCLKGPPGAGKTLFVSSLSKILNSPVEWIDFAGQQDVHMIRGQMKTWVGAKVGAIVDAIINLKCMNGYIVLEEIDKIDGKYAGDLFNILTIMLDRTRNTKFYDNYLSPVHIDLSKVKFICTINEDRSFPRPLLDRLHIIDIEKPNLDRKIKIARNFLFPTALKERKISPENLVLSDDIIRYIIHKTESEDGVRRLKRNIESIVQRFNYYYQLYDHEKSNQKEIAEKISFKIPNFKLPLTLNEKHVDQFLSHMKKDDEVWKRMVM